MVPGDGTATFHVQYDVYHTIENFPWATVVEVIWIFDTEGKLESVTVRRYVDSI